MRIVFSLLFLSILACSPLFGQYGLGMSLLRDNVISQKYNPANIMEGKNSKEYHGMILDFDSTSFKFGVDATGWLSNNRTSLQGILAENGYITPETRERMVADMGDKTRLGAGYNLGYVNLNVKIKGKTWAFFLEENQSVNAKWNNNSTPGLAFFGNGRYVGETVTDENIQANLTFTRSLGVGYGWNLMEDDKLKIGVRGKLIQGINTLDLQNANYSLFTETDGTRILLNGQYDFVQAANDQTLNPFSFQGFGIGADVGMIYQVDTNFRLTASVLDVGAIMWNAERYENTISDLDWQGYDLGDFFNGNTPGDFDETTDSLIDIVLVDSVDENYITPTATRISIGGDYDLNEKMNLGAAIWYAPFMNGAHTPLPLLNVSYQYQVIPNLRLGANAYTGVQGRYGVGLIGNYHFLINKDKKKTRFDLIVGADNILGVLAPSVAWGANVFGGISVGM